MAGFYDSFDVAVVGAGHGGIEAALSCARMGLKTILITQTIDSIGRMSCNPSIGGIAKGNIVREIDALGGEMAHLIDKSMIQFRMLNKSRGPAVQAPRSQADKLLYAQLARQTLELHPNLSTLQDTVVDVGVVESSTPLPEGSDSAAPLGSIPGETRGAVWNGRKSTTLPADGSATTGDNVNTDKSANVQPRLKITELVTERGRHIPVRAAVLTTGTFLGGRVFIGEYDAPMGRLGESGAYGLTSSLNKLGFTTGRLKTGTPPRILRSTIDFSSLEVQNGDDEVIPFSFDNTKIERPMVPCYLVYTNNETHKIIRANIGRSPLYSGKISGIGPRYCPSIEDKVMRFAERERHQLFIEPEGLATDEIYLNGFSSSLPESVQDAFLRTLPGFKDAVIARPGYAVEYDYVEPTQLFPSLETKRVAGLFCAGQINGTSGYEEAAGQGLVAGINAGLYAKAHSELCGPLSKAVQTQKDAENDVPYTSSPTETAELSGTMTGHSDRLREIPEYEPLVLRRDEAYIGVLIDDLVTLGTREPYRMFTARAEYRLKLRHDTADERLFEKAWKIGLKSDAQMQHVRDKVSARDEILALLAKKSDATNPGYPDEFWQAALIDFKYIHYIEKQDKRVDKMKRMEDFRIPVDFDYKKVVGLSAESRQKLEKVRPLTLGQASRISGIRPSDTMLLMVSLGR